MYYNGNEWVSGSRSRDFADNPSAGFGATSYQTPTWLLGKTVDQTPTWLKGTTVNARANGYPSSMDGYVKVDQTPAYLRDTQNAAQVAARKLSDSKVGRWTAGAAKDTANWVKGAANDTTNWVKGAAEDVADWTTGMTADQRQAMKAYKTIEDKARANANVALASGDRGAGALNSNIAADAAARQEAIRQSTDNVFERAGKGVAQGAGAVKNWLGDVNLADGINTPAEYILTGAAAAAAAGLGYGGAKLADKMRARKQASKTKALAQMI